MSSSEESATTTLHVTSCSQTTFWYLWICCVGFGRRIVGDTTLPEGWSQGRTGQAPLPPCTQHITLTDRTDAPSITLSITYHQKCRRRACATVISEEGSIRSLTERFRGLVLGRR